MVEYGNAVGSALGGIGSTIGGLWDSFASSVAGAMSNATRSAMSLGWPAVLVGGLVVVAIVLLTLRGALR
ncbi:MAG TPA: hypothetical protein VF802_07300 [Candidatus Limnocylindrales bacterium]